jgi:hypothetical protein
MKLASLLVLAVVLSGARPALAQQKPPAQDAPRQDLPPPPLVPANGGTAPSSASPPGESIPRSGDAPREELSFFPRAGLGLLGGLGGGLVWAGVGTMAGQLAVLPVGCEREVCSGARLSGAFVGALLGVPAGTYFAGELTGGRGSYASALAGSLVGWGFVSIGQYLFVANGDGIGDAELDDDGLAVAVLLTLPALGSTLGYQISHAQTTRQPQGPGRWIAVRVLLEVLFGSIGGATAGLGGFIGGFGASSSCSPLEPCSSTGDEIVINTLVVSSLMAGSALGVYAAGRLMKGRGSFLPTIAGAAIGATVAGAALATGETAAGVLLLLSAPLTGAIIGYEVSNALAEAEAEPAVGALRPGAGSLEVLPVIAVTPAGGLLGGLAGRF